jgi:hypothetical protein
MAMSRFAAIMRALLIDRYGSSLSLVTNIYDAFASFSPTGGVNRVVTSTTIMLFSLAIWAAVIRSEFAGVSTSNGQEFKPNSR